MKDRGKGILRILCILIVLAGISFVAFLGIGEGKTGSLYNVNLGLDLAGGVSITYQSVAPDPSAESMDDTVYKMQKRAENFSTESAVYQEGDNRITVDIPDVTDADAVLEKMGSAGTIYFVYGKGPSGVQNIEQKLNEETGILEFVLTRPMEEIIKDKDVVIDGTQIEGAEPVSRNTETGMEYLVQLNLNESGKKSFAKATEYAAAFRGQVAEGINYANIIAIVYDGRVESAPGVEEPITGGTATISGQRSFQEAKELSSVIRIGALPLELSVLRYNIVGAKLGAEAISTSLIAGVIGFIIVFLFMIIVYRIPGAAASLALILYVGLMILALNVFGVTLTLPGVAGILLSVGMAVDANVIVFTRIQEELAAGKTVRSSMKAGFSKALSAIVDGNVTTLIAAAVLFFIGSGTVKGFAQTLAIGIVLSMITALFVTRFILHSFYALGFDDVKYFGMKKEKRVFGFVKNFKKFALVSVVIIVIGVAMLIVNNARTGEILNYSLDFKGGTSTEIEFPNQPPDGIQKELEQLIKDTTGLNAEISMVKETNSAVVKTQEMTTEQRMTMMEALKSQYGIDQELITTETISATVSGEMKRDAIIAVLVAAVCMLIYIWIRFKNINFAGSAVIALLHDVLIVITLYAVCSFWLSVGNTFIACILTIVGYSINATIVIFDRIRENMKDKLKKDSIEDVVNRSISQTLTRSINTSLTTFIMVLMLAILGVASVREFAIPLIAGIVCGTYSSVCITGGLWYQFQKRIKKQD